MKAKLNEFAKKRQPHSLDLALASPDPASPDEHFFDHEVATRSILRLQESKSSEKPLFLVCGFRLPHTPWQAPARFFQAYTANLEQLRPQEADFPQLLPPLGTPDVALTWSQKAYTSHYNIQNVWQKQVVTYKTNVDYNPWRPLPPGVIADLRHGYAASASFMDAQLGRVLDAIWQDEKLRNNTIIGTFTRAGPPAARADAGRPHPAWPPEMQLSPPITASP